MYPSIDVAIMLLNIALGVVCIALIRVFAGSIFADIAKFMFILAVGLMAHSAIDVFLPEPFPLFIYGVSGLVISICYLLLVYAVYVALKNIMDGVKTK